MRSAFESAFDAAMLDIYKRAKSEAHYTAARFWVPSSAGTTIDVIAQRCVSRLLSVPAMVSTGIRHAQDRSAARPRR